jgi:hypothetical protein
MLLDMKHFSHCKGAISLKLAMAVSRLSLAHRLRPTRSWLAKHLLDAVAVADDRLQLLATSGFNLGTDASLISPEFACDRRQGNFLSVSMSTSIH